LLFTQALQRREGVLGLPLLPARQLACCVLNEPHPFRTEELPAPAHDVLMPLAVVLSERLGQREEVEGM
jgi:hypothetical protein